MRFDRLELVFQDLRPRRLAISTERTISAIQDVHTAKRARSVQAMAWPTQRVDARRDCAPLYGREHAARVRAVSRIEFPGPVGRRSRRHGSDCSAEPATGTIHRGRSVVRLRAAAPCGGARCPITAWNNAGRTTRSTVAILRVEMMLLNRSTIYGRVTRA